MAFFPSLAAHQSNLGDMGSMNSMQYQGEITHQLIPSHQGEITHQLIPSQGYNSLEMEPLAFLPYEPPRQVHMIIRQKSFILHIYIYT
jgi:hypothetical protein